MTESRISGSGPAMHALIGELYPICRSITGEGFRRSLRRLGEVVPIVLSEIPSGTPVFDWTVPKEWNIRDGWIADTAGRRVIDFRASTLHVVNYSVPVRARMSLSELRPRLHTLPDQPDLIPYRTSYYTEDWGFCLSHRQLSSTARRGIRGLHRCHSRPRALDLSASVCCPARPTTRSSSASTAATPRWPTTTSRGWRLRCFSRGICPSCLDSTPFGSCSSRAPSGRSPGWRSTRRRPGGSGTDWCCPVWAMGGLPPTSGVGGVTLSWTGPRSTSWPHAGPPRRARFHSLRV